MARKTDNDGGAAVPATAGGEIRARRSAAILVPGRAKPSAVTMIVFGAVLAAVQLANSLTSGWLATHGGILPRSLDGLIGIVTAPLLHASWAHLLTNLVPFLVLGFLVLIAGGRQFTAVTVPIWLLSGVGVWLIGSAHTVTVGASGVVMGWLAYLVVRGVFTRRISQILLGLVLLALWGGMLWGVLPGRPDISWQGHLCGALGGTLAAFLVAKADAEQRRRLAS